MTAAYNSYSTANIENVFNILGVLKLQISAEY